MEITCDTGNVPLGALITAAYLRTNSEVVAVNFGDKNSVKFPDNTVSNLTIINTSPVLCRALADAFPNYKLYGQSTIEEGAVDSWLRFSSLHLKIENKTEDNNQRVLSKIEYLNNVLATKTYLVSNQLTVADFSVYAALFCNPVFKTLLTSKTVPEHLARWYNLINSLPFVTETISKLPNEASNLLSVKKNRRSISRSPSRTSSKPTKTDNKVDGKFVDLPNAVMGEVVVRFPPEASGYLHIGHAKAALLNQYYQVAFNGKLIMRFDDTNPAKENVEFENVILKDVEMLQIKPDRFTYSSDYFEEMLQLCEKLLKEGKAFADDTDPETMKLEREQRQKSKNRNNSVDRNFEMWKAMLAGTEYGQKCCIRAKIDMSSDNGCMRDPTIYRCKNEPHPRTGNKYKVYPTYDFACPIVDAVEGVTHTLRTMEYHDRDDQFYWFIEALGLRRPYIWEYSRLSMTNTVLSKRKLTWFVEQGLVDGWDDPRMPTVRGVLRRGMTVEGLRQFIISQGSSRSVVFMEWDKIWAINKKIIDPIAPRYTALEEHPITVKVKDCKTQVLTVPKHPKNPELGTKQITIGEDILIDAADALVLKENENATFINWGNLKILKINKDAQGKIVDVLAEQNLENKDYKKTPKLTWLCRNTSSPSTPTTLVYFDHIISKPLLAKDEDFKKYVGHNTRTDVAMWGDYDLRTLKEGDIIELQRRGFFRVDRPYQPATPQETKVQPIILFAIPDGTAKKPAIAQTTKAASPVATKTESASSNDINQAIVNQGNKVRQLKTDKAAKDVIDAAVKELLALKAEFKKQTGSDWKPGMEVTLTTKASTQNSGDINQAIVNQGNKVRQLKSDKAAKDVVDAAVKELLVLKAEFKKQTGNDWKPGMELTPAVNIPVQNSDAVNQAIVNQGNKVRQLKTDKAAKDVIDAAVKELLALKTEFKKQTGNDWKPGMESTPATNAPVQNSDALNQAIINQGNKVRQLKSDKAAKDVTDAAVKELLALKADFKKQTGSEWKPTAAPPASAKIPEKTADSINQAIVTQGNKVRQLKSDKAAKDVVDAAVKELLSLKAEFKTLTGSDWKPQDVSSVVKSKPSTNMVVTEGDVSTKSPSGINKSIQEQGDIVRKLKSEKAAKDVIDAAVKQLLSLKNDFKVRTGIDWKPGCSVPEDGTPIQPSPVCTTAKVAAKPKAKAAPKKVEAKQEDSSKKQTRLCLEAKKSENLSDWYSQVITKSEMIEYYDVSGCYIYRPWSFSIWSKIREFFEAEIQKLGVQECYFPIFVSKAALEREKTHISDFAPEVAWVTKSGDSELAEPIAIRPTSETIMYSAYAKWVQSYRDLPIKLNQWNNVVRWEFKHPQPFLRTREFLWQEGHTAFASKAEAEAEILDILELYARVYTDLLAVPVIKGRKTEKEKFAGGDYTTTVEGYVAASGRGVQGATSHHLGQNFSKMFDITYEDPETQEKKYIYQNSWGISTRSIGVMIMVHSDDQGLVLPPNVACIQIIVVPCGITASLGQEDREKLLASCKALESDLKSVNVRCEGDYRDNYSPGWKFNHWELKGVPIRVELGPKDLKNDQLVAVRRDTAEKTTISRKTAVADLQKMLKDIHDNLYAKALKDFNDHKILCTDWATFVTQLDLKNLLLSPFCGAIECEDQIKADSTRDDGTVEPGAPAMGAKSLCIPFDQPKPITEADKCIHPKCQRKPQKYTLFGRSY